MIVYEIIDKISTSSPVMKIFNSRILVLILHVLFLSCIFSISNGVPSCINCLHSTKNSLEDPLNHLNNLISESFACTKEGRIELSNKGLKGPFPHGMGNCTNIQTLDLSSNNLVGPLPTDICEKLPLLESLNLSNNKFSGEIPPTIAVCRYLNSIVLDNNSFTGQIPWQITKLEQLKVFSVSNNMLSGHVPDFAFRNFPKESYANNTGLCGGPLEPCCHRWSKFKQGFVAGFLVFAVSNFVILGFM